MQIEMIIQTEDKIIYRVIRSDNCGFEPLILIERDFDGNLEFIHRTRYYNPRICDEWIPIKNKNGGIRENAN